MEDDGISDDGTLITGFLIIFQNPKKKKNLTLMYQSCDFFFRAAGERDLQVELGFWGKRDTFARSLSGTAVV